MKTDGPCQEPRISAATARELSGNLSCCFQKSFFMVFVVQILILKLPNLLPFYSLLAAVLNVKLSRSIQAFHISNGAESALSKSLPSSFSTSSISGNQWADILQRIKLPRTWTYQAGAEMIFRYLARNQFQVRGAIPAPASGH